MNQENAQWRRERAREIDRQAIDDFRIPALLLMEHASIGLAVRALEALFSLGVESGSGRVLLLCGPGNNGGDGFAVARHLHQQGTATEVWDLDGRAKRDSDGDSERELQLDLLDSLGVPVVSAATALPEPGPRPDLVIDAILGSGLNRPPEGIYHEAIAATQRWGVPVLSVDIPSGLDADDGRPLGIAVEATWTVTMAIPKQGFLREESRRFVGELSLVPIGVPRQILPPGVPGFPPLPHPTAITDRFLFGPPPAGGQL